MSGQDFRDMIESSNPSAPEAPKARPRERKTYLDEIVEGQEVYFKKKKYTVAQINGDNITLSNGKVVKKEDLDKNEGAAYVPSSGDESEDEYMSDISIQHEY